MFSQDDQVWLGEQCYLDMCAGRFVNETKSVRLTWIEIRIMRCLALKLGTIVIRDNLIKSAWGEKALTEGYDFNPNELRVYISRLRNKTEDTPNNPRYLLNVPGIGYLLLPR